MPPSGVLVKPSQSTLERGGNLTIIQSKNKGKFVLRVLLIKPDMPYTGLAPGVLVVVVLDIITYTVLNFPGINL
jgi:hypothetical protein